MASPLRGPLPVPELDGAVIGCSEREAWATSHQGVVSGEATVEVSPLLPRDTYVSFIFISFHTFKTTTSL